MFSLSIHHLDKVRIWVMFNEEETDLGAKEEEYNTPPSYEEEQLTREIL